MLNPKSLIRINKLSRNPQAIHAMYYDLDDQSGFILEKRLKSFICVCAFCLGFTNKLTESHFIQTIHAV